MDYTDLGAVVSNDGRYRYMLWREWRGTHDPKNWHWEAYDGTGEKFGSPKPCVFIMLNPSTADADIDDPTIRKCVGFASRWNFEKLVVVNLFAYRATKPTELLKVNHNGDPVGVQNQHYIRRALDHAGRVVCAWGSHGGHLRQDKTMVCWLDEAGIERFYALGYDAKDNPRHPLMMPYDSKLVRYNPL